MIFKNGDTVIATATTAAIGAVDERLFIITKLLLCLPMPTFCAASGRGLDFIKQRQWRYLSEQIESTTTRVRYKMANLLKSSFDL